MMEKDSPTKNNSTDAFAELEKGVYAALETYSNVHRGSGHYSVVTTHLYEQAREIVLEYLGLNKSRYSVIFCSPAKAAALEARLAPENYQSVSGSEIGLSLGVRALAVNRKVLPKGAPYHTGGGTTRLVSKEWVIWAKTPDKFEAGTPAIINVIAFARALQLVQQYGKDIFQKKTTENLTPDEILYHDELENYSGPELLDKLRQTIIGRGVQVPTMEGVKPFINLDNSASTPTFNPVWEAFRKTLCQPAEVQQEIVQEVKSVCATILGAPLSSYDVLFTSNTTEAINLAAKNLSREPADGFETIVLSTLLEHSSNDLPWRMIPGSSVIRLTVDDEGFISLSELENLLKAYNHDGLYGKKRIRLLAINGASNVLGICNNIGEISRIVHQYEASLLVDAAQLVAHRRIGMEECGIDYLAFSAHKVYAPFGCGVLVAKKGLLTFNADELETIRSSGEENAAGIAALGKALLLLHRVGMNLLQEEEQALTARMLIGMAQIPGLKIYGIKNPESPAFAHKLGVIVFSLKGSMPEGLAKELAFRSGIGVRYGCHCAHIIVKHLLNVGPNLEQFQRLIVTLFPKLQLPGLVRVSLGIENSAEEVDKFLHVLEQIWKKSKSSTHSNSASQKNDTVIVSRTDVRKQMIDFTSEVSQRVYS
jgi:selenocysteine lyase/cysteine desulfurase